MVGRLSKHGRRVGLSSWVWVFMRKLGEERGDPIYRAVSRSQQIHTFHRQNSYCCREVITTVSFPRRTIIQLHAVLESTNIPIFERNLSDWITEEQ